MADYLPLAQRVHYLSTACIHAHHDACRVTCKFCPAPCRCVCHQSANQPTEEPAMIHDPNEPAPDETQSDQPDQLPERGPVTDDPGTPQQPERRPDRETVPPATQPGEARADDDIPF